MSQKRHKAQSQDFVVGALKSLMKDREVPGRTRLDAIMLLMWIDKMLPELPNIGRITPGTVEPPDNDDDDGTLTTSAEPTPTPAPVRETPKPDTMLEALKGGA